MGIIPLFRIILRSKYHWFHLFWIQSLLTLDLWQCLLFSRVWNRTYDHKRRMMSNFVNFQRTCKTAKCSKICWILKTFDLIASREYSLDFHVKIDTTRLLVIYAFFKVFFNSSVIKLFCKLYCWFKYPHLFFYVRYNLWQLLAEGEGNVGLQYSVWYQGHHLKLIAEP